MNHTRTFAAMHGGQGDTGIDDDWAQRSFHHIGAWILGRNMFGPVRGPWPDNDWRGWWGDEPPYHVPVFVLTHHPRAPLQMKGGTVFHFVTGGIHEALQRAREAAAGQDVRIGGGVATVRQYLQAGLVDEMHLVQSPVLLGRGGRCWPASTGGAGFPLHRAPGLGTRAAPGAGARLKPRQRRQRGARFSMKARGPSQVLGRGDALARGHRQRAQLVLAQVVGAARDAQALAHRDGRVACDAAGQVQRFVDDTTGRCQAVDEAVRVRAPMRPAARPS